MSLRNIVLTAFFCVAAIAATPAMGKTSGAQKLLGTFGQWRTFSFQENKQPVCYMALTISSAPHAGMKRRTAHLIVTHRPAENSKDVISYDAGYNFKAETDVMLHIDKAKFDLFTTKDTAWARDSVTDHKIAAAIRHGAHATITGIPATKIKGAISITDNLNLTGAMQAYQAIGKACGIEPDPADVPPTKKKSAYKPMIANPRRQ